MTASPLLFLSNHGPIVGGGEISLLTLMTALDPARWRPLLVVPEEGRVAEAARVAGIPTWVIPFPALKRPRRALFNTVGDLRSLMRDQHVRIVHANGSRAMAYGGLAGLLAGKPVIWHVRIADQDGWLDRGLARLATRIIVNSEAVRRRFPLVPDDKVRRIHNGVDLTRFVPQVPPDSLRATLGLGALDPVVVSVGRFVPFKGYDTLIEAAASVRRTEPQLHWVLVGDGEQRESLLEQCVSRGLSSHVHVVGWKDDVRPWLALGDLFVLPSLAEHFGRVIVEAMAMGKPVVATDAGGVPEIVAHGETGLLVPPGDAGRLAEAVLHLLHHRAELTRCGIAGRRRAERHFSLTGHAEAVGALYEELIEASCAAPDAAMDSRPRENMGA